MIQALNKRMEAYEKEYNLPINIPLILRIDGRAFHTFTRSMDKPFDNNFINLMNAVGLGLCNDIQNCRMAYLQSDEISFLIYNKIESSTWFDNSIQKICSVSSSLASSIATIWLNRYFPDKSCAVSFDARVNLYPEKDVVNYFVWRQQDWERNSVQMVARSYYSQKQLQGKNNADMQEMIFQKGDNWDKYPTYLKRGRCIIKIKKLENIVNNNFSGEVERSRWILDTDIPIFSKRREYIEDRLGDDFIFVLPTRSEQGAWPSGGAEG